MANNITTAKIMICAAPPPLLSEERLVRHFMRHDSLYLLTAKA
jgi:hypothetical protein